MNNNSVDPKNNVFKESVNIAGDKSNIVKGYDFNEEFDICKMIEAMKTTGIQGTYLHKGISIINKMIDSKDPKCTIFLGYTSNIVSSGLRETIRYLCEHKMVDAIVASAGGVEEDIVKCLGDSILYDHSKNDYELREDGLNRIGNMIVPNENYCKFEDFLRPIMTEMLKEQQENDVNWTPSKMIDLLGKRINNKNSIYYWCHKNKIPVFSPALTDGSLGDMLFFNSINNPELRLDIIEDIKILNKIALKAEKTGSIILGGGLIKHHIFNANLMRNGMDYCVVINTASEYDCSDAGASMNEAISWGKIAPFGEFTKIHSEVSLVLNLIISQTFKKKEQLFKDRLLENINEE